MFCHLKHYIQAKQENIDVFYFASGMHVYANNIEPRRFYHPLNVAHLVNADAKLTINMTCRHFVIATGHNVRIKPNTNRITAAKLVAKLLQ